MKEIQQGNWWCGPVASLKQREDNRQASRTRSPQETTWYSLLIIIIMIITMTMMTMEKMTVILTNHIACHSRSEGKPQGQCNQAFQLKRIILFSQKVKRKELTRKTARTRQWYQWWWWWLDVWWCNLLRKPGPCAFLANSPAFVCKVLSWEGSSWWWGWEW